MDFTVCRYICVHIIGIPSISTETSERVTLIMADGLKDFTHPVDTWSCSVERGIVQK